MAAPRAVLEDWFSRWPTDSRPDLRARLRAKDDGQFLGAFWELYLHELHLRLGFECERDPELPDSPRRPDFLVHGAGGSFYLEATVVGYPTAQASVRKRRRLVLDMVNAAHHPDFALRLHALTPGDRQPSRREVVAAVEGWLSMFDWNEESKRVGEPGRPAQAIDLGGGWRLRGVPWPRPARGDRSFPTVVTNRLGVGVIDEPPTILDDLREKAGSYGRPARPFVIAVLCARDFATEHDIEQALYGPEVVRIPVGPDGPLPVAGEIDREPQGLWQRGEQQRATRVSAVLSAVLLDPWSIASVPLWLWLNPWAARPLVAGLPWGTVSGDLGANAIVRAEGQREPRDVLGLPEGWPRRAAA